MRSERLRPPSRGRLARRLGTAAVVAMTVTTSACALPGRSSSEDSGPPRLSPAPRHEVVDEMIEGRAAPTPRLRACDLLDLTTEEVAELTGTDLPDVEPTGTGDLGDLCTYGGPGSLERLEAEAAETETSGAESGTDAESNGDAADSGATSSTSAATTPATTPTSATGDVPADAEADTAQEDAAEEDGVPDSVSAGAVKPRGGARRALAGQAALLGARYACSEIRGEGAERVEGGGPAAPGAPARVRPEPPSVYIDCVAAPTGGGTEVHTIFVAHNDLWHLAVIRPGTPRSPEADADALAGAHRLAAQILD